MSGPQTLLLGALGFVPLGGVTIAYSANTSFVQSINMGAVIPITAGREITAVRAEIRDVAGSTMTLILNRIDAYGSSTPLGASVASSGTGTNQTLTVASGLPITTIAGSNYSIVAVRSSGVGTDLNVSTVEIDYD